MKYENIDRANELAKERYGIIGNRMRVRAILNVRAEDTPTITIAQDVYMSDLSFTHNKEDVFAMLRKEERRLNVRLKEIDAEFSEL